MAAISLLAGCSLMLGEGYTGGSGVTPPVGPEAGPDAAPGDASAGGDADADAGVVYRDIVLADAPVAYWPMDDAIDAPGIRDVISGAESNYFGGLELGVPGIAATAARFGSPQPWVAVGNGYDLGNGPYAIEFWAKPTLRNTFHNVLEKRHAMVEDGYVLYFRWQNNVASVQMERNYPNGSQGADAIVDRNEWIHVVFTFDGKNLRVYIDGVDRTSGEYVEGKGATTPSGVEVEIGNSFEGVLDEVAIYDHALTLQRIKAHFAAGRIL